MMHRTADHTRPAALRKSVLLLPIIICYLASSFLCAFGQTAPTDYYDVQIELSSGKSEYRALLKKLKEIGAPLYSLPDRKGKIVVDVNADERAARLFIERNLSGLKAVPVISRNDVAPNTALVASGIYPFEQIYHYLPKPSEISGRNEEETEKKPEQKRMTIRELAGMPPKPGELSATELAALPPKPPALSARELVRLSRDGSSQPSGTGESDVAPQPGKEQDFQPAASHNADRAEFITVITDYINRKNHGSLPDPGQIELARKMAAYYATWIFDAARLYRLDPFLLVAIPQQETNFMNVDGDLNHFTNGVRNHSEGIFQMLKTTQEEVYLDMQNRGLAGLISWRPGMDLKKFPQDQVYMAAHFLRFFCEAYPKNYHNALTIYNGSPSYPNQVFEKLKEVTRFYLQQTS